MKKKTLSKVAYNWLTNFFMYWPGCPNDPETEIPYHPKPLNAGLGILTGRCTIIRLYDSATEIAT